MCCDTLQAMTDSPANPRDDHSIRIYWEDTDAGGVVYYANYLKFFERARTEWLRTLGVEQQALKRDTGAMFVVSEVQVRYLVPAKLDDLITVRLRLVELGKASLVLAQQAWRADTLLASATVRIGCVDATSLRPRRMPELVLNSLPSLMDSA